MASPIAEQWIFTTMLIESGSGRGTGFLVGRDISEQKMRLFLVTNKHVLHPDLQGRQNVSDVLLHCNFKEDDDSIGKRTITLEFGTLADGSKCWREHPDQDIDVLAIDVTSVLLAFPQLVFRCVSYDIFSDQQKINELEISIGEEVAVIGYPLGLKHHTTNLPLVRSGIIATKIGESLEDKVGEPDGTLRDRIIRGFIIDGGTIPGSSGSPVILKPVTGRHVNNKILLNPAPALLLGILAKTKYAPVITPTLSIPSFAGLGIAFDADTVRETIELFFTNT